MGKNILIVGGGGREHALAQSLSESPTVDKIICTPGNAGTAGIENCRNLPSSGSAEILNLALNEKSDLVVIGPEQPLAEGLVDLLGREGIKAFGPPSASARLESSKGFAKDFMARNGVATAGYLRFEDPEKARAALDSFGFPVVVKADGLAAGKGVLICADRKEAEDAVDSVMLNRDFGAAGDEIVIEEFLSGWETSIIGLTDGKSFLSFLPAKDHKRAGEGDTGLNTGGMGVIAPHPQVDEKVMADIQQNIINPTISGLEKENLGYAGFLFIGVMVGPDGPKTLEYNVRFGDPEAQALLPLLSGDLNLYMEAALEGRLAGIRPEWRSGASCCVIMASGGYPEDYQTGFPISGIEKAEELGCRVYCAGVKEDETGKFLSSGGRVLGVSAIADNLKSARKKAYSGISSIDFQGGWFRRDIGGD
jgi:phosphoribosylamine--glycine ligase